MLRFSVVFLLLGLSSVFSTRVYKPQPAHGASNPSVDQYSSTAGRPYDDFTGMSLEQLKFAADTWEVTKTAAYKASDVSPDEGWRIYGKQMGYMLNLWFPESAAGLGLPNLDVLWLIPEVDVIETRFGRLLNEQWRFLTAQDHESYIRLEDNLAYFHHHLNVKPGQQKLVIQGFLYYTGVQTYTVNFFLGSNYTAKIEAAMKNVFRYQNWTKWSLLDLYDTGCLERTADSVTNARPNYSPDQPSIAG